MSAGKPLKSFQVATWKIVVSITVSVAGAALVAIGIPVSDLSRPFIDSAVFYGAVLTVAGILFGAATIRCPVCGSRLLLRSATVGTSLFGRTRYWFELARISRPTTCPRCYDDLRSEIGRFRVWDIPESHPASIIGRLVFGAWDLFNSAAYVIIAAIVVRLSVQSSLIGAILLATAGIMVAIVVIRKLGNRNP